MAARFDIRKAGGQAAILVGIALVANIGFYLFWTRPAVQDYKGLLANSPSTESLDEQRQIVEEAERYLEAVQRARSDLTRLRDEVLSTRSQRMVGVQLELARLAQQFQIDLDSVNYENEMLEDEGLERFAMVVPLEGGYTALRRFLQAVEDSEEFIVVERVAIGKGKQGGVLLQLNITLATYFNPTASRMERDGRRRAAGSGAAPAAERTRRAREASARRGRR